MRPAIPTGIYAVTDATLTPGERLAPAVAAALRGGARIVQYRDKSDDKRRRLQEAATLRTLCSQFGALYLINDDAELALAVGADGVHIGRDDGEPASVRERLGDRAVLGVSCYADADRARRAAEADADYVAFGSMYPSPTKPDAVRAQPELFAAAADLGLPAVAIGGIGAGNVGHLSGAGAHAAAVISAIFADPDPEAATRRLKDAWEAGLTGMVR